MDSLALIFEKIRSFFSFITSKIGIATEFLMLSIYKIFGKERVQNFNKSLSLFSGKFNNGLYGHLDARGDNYVLIRKIYKVFYRTLGVSLVYLLMVKTNFLWLTGGMPSIEQLQNPKLAQASTVISADGVELGKYFAENRIPVDSNQISPWVFKALIATEDKRFNEHAGIDIMRMGGVLKGIITGNKDSGGGSTISQQLAKNLYNTRRKEMKGLLSYIPLLKTLVYKTKEWITAVELEKRFTKGEISTLYLNTVDYGNNSFGIKTASKTYFNKTPDKLNISEAAILVGLQKATTAFNPIKNFKKANIRRNVVIGRMVTNGDLDQKTADKIMAKEIVLNVNTEDNYDGQSNYFKIALAKFLEKWSEKTDTPLDLYRDGLKIYVTLDSRMQSYGEQAMEKHMKMLQKEFDAQWKGKNPWTYETGEEIPNYIENAARKLTVFKDLEIKFNGNKDSISYYMNKPHDVKVFSWDGVKKINMSTMDSIAYYKKFLQAGMMAYDPYSGFIKSWVGGTNYDFFKYDHVKQGKRQPGSAFKAIVYAAAIDGPMNLSPCDRRKDKEFEMKWRENGVEKVWKPKNANGKFTNSNMSLRTAISRSVNSVAVQLVYEMKPKVVIDYAKKMGINSPIDNVTSIALGTSDVSLYELAGAYGVFLNEGLYREPIFVYKVEDKSGKVLVEFEPETKQAIKPESAYLMQYMLRGNVEEGGGTGRRLLGYQELFKNNGQAAGKTGTTSNNSDAWYVGFTKDLVCGVWVGGEERSIHFRGGLGEGSKSALPIFGLFMDKVYADKSLNYKAGPFPKPKTEPEKDYMHCTYVSAGGRRATIVDDSLYYDYSGDSSSGSSAPRRIVDSIKVIDRVKKPVVQSDSTE